MNKTQQKYVPAPAYQPPQQTVIVQNVHFGPRPVSKKMVDSLRSSKGQLISKDTIPASLFPKMNAIVVITQN